MPDASNRFRALERLRPVPVLVKVFLLGLTVVASLALLGFALNADWRLVKVGEESNLPTWFSSVQLFAIAGVLSLIVFRDADRSKPSTWKLAVVPGLFILLSLDEIAMIHELLGDWLTANTGIGAGLRTGPWVVIFVPLVALLTLASAIVFRPYLQGRRDVMTLAVLGFAIFGLSAAGLELTGNIPVDGSVAHKLVGFAEEVGEMLAANIILWSAVLVVQYEGIRVDLGTPRRRGSVPTPEPDEARPPNASLPT